MGRFFVASISCGTSDYLSILQKYSRPSLRSGLVIFAGGEGIGQALVRRRHSSLRLATFASLHLLMEPPPLTFDSFRSAQG